MNEEEVPTIEKDCQPYIGCGSTSQEKRYEPQGFGHPSSKTETQCISRVGTHEE